MPRKTMTPDQLRSRQWFDNPDDPEMTALYLERYLNYGLTRAELQGGKPIIGIAQTGSDLSPCNRHHIELASRLRDGIIAAGGVPFEIPVHPIQETGRRPTANLDRNLAYMGLVELLHGYPLDGVVLTIGCDKTTPALLMAAAAVNLPAIAFSVGPMLNGWFKGERAGSGSVVWQARKMLAAGEIDNDGFFDLVASSAPSVGFCNTMGTASTMNSLAEVLGMQLPGSAAIPAPYRERGQMARATGERIVEMVWEDLRPSDILTRPAFENAIAACSALGGSTNAPIHINAIARHAGVTLNNDDWDRLGRNVPLIVNLQPAGIYLGEDFHRAGGVPAVLGEMHAAGHLPHPQAATVAGTPLLQTAIRSDAPDVIRSFDMPVNMAGGFVNLRGNLFDSAIMKLSVISEAFRTRYLSDPDDPDAFEGTAYVFDGPEDYHHRIDDPALNIPADAILIMRGAGPLGYPGAAEVVNMRPPNYLIRQGTRELPCIGDGRQSGTSGSPSILNASPEAAAGGNLALVQDGDRIRVDLKAGRVDLLLAPDQLAERRAALEAAGGYAIPAPQTPWQEIFRERTGQLCDGMVLQGADGYSDIARKSVPRNNH
ncbi:dihydroxy-acid dehydratase [Thioclava sp. SK-1]|uniref:IlvD/Edd family dehydratase n=1 Tax=Thioclava sp. SK-1 TaxID=1889770 RepID=UPI000825D386|nr:IlvD/Edd family dehydratase [Thioclava sp. SK-1]OCX58143.1 dihydroxy-acid dehydratase [Thioclava sp. SK-1]